MNSFSFQMSLSKPNLSLKNICTTSVFSMSYMSVFLTWPCRSRCFTMHRLKKKKKRQERLFWPKYLKNGFNSLLFISKLLVCLFILLYFGSSPSPSIFSLLFVILEVYFELCFIKILQTSYWVYLSNQIVGLAVSGLTSHFHFVFVL